MKMGNRQEAKGNRRKLTFPLCALGALLFALCASALAQQAAKMPRIGYLAVSSVSSHVPRVAMLRQGLRELGYVENQNIIIEFKYANGKSERLLELATELVRERVEAIVTTGTQGAVAAKSATTNIPVIMVTGNNPVARGLILSLGRPGGNITGLTSDAGELSGKRVEVLKETIPNLLRLGVLWYPGDPGAAANFAETEVAAHGLGIQAYSLRAGDEKDIDAAFKSAQQAKVQALTVLSSGEVNAHRKQIIQFATKSRLPSMFSVPTHVEEGGLLFYGANIPEQYRRAAYFVDKILKGAKPAALPVEQPTKFELVVNLRTAKQIGLAIPPNVLARADRVIR